jgi:ABC-type sugar transport system ATPase subunit
VIGFEFVTVRAGAFALGGVSFEVPTGGYAVLMGRTGSGKTTLLEAVCGLRPVESGRIVLAGRDVTALQPGERGIGYVPQDRALFQTMTVRQHLGFAPSIQRWTAADTDARVRELADLLRIAPLLDRLPAGLSGGEAQRVALGRALAARPKVLLLDEPLSALDDETWEGMIGLLGQVRKAAGVTILHVTHRREEARRLADRVFVLADGAVRPAAAADLQEQTR